MVELSGAGDQVAEVELTGPALDAELERIAEETGETVETVRDLYDAMRCCAEEEELEERYG